MGCESSSPIADEKSVSLSVTWRPLLSSSEAKNKYINEGTLPKVCSSGQLEFRGLLDDAIALVYLRKAAAENNIEEFLACWLEIYSFKFPKPNVLFSGPYQIYQRYLHADKVVGKSSLISKEKSQEIASYFDKDAKQIPVNVFDFLVLPLFEMLYEQVFIDFKSTVPYYNMAELLRKKYNSGKPHDFTYYEVLGEGGFGIVVHVVKKSTGKHYAMKIQTKEGLFKSVSCVPWRTDFEKQALVSCRHPFIIELHYAFQSKTMVMLVTTLGSYKTLGAVLKEVPNRQLDRERVVFYGAEITCALMYLHTMGLIYRDLKPGNVLLLQDGHIQLIDLGSVIDVQGLTLGVEKESDGMAPIFAAIARRESESSGLRTPPGDGTAMPNVEGVSIAQLDGELSLSSAENSSNVARLTRARSIVGTFGYMAPEMAVMLAQNDNQQMGYSQAVDWWSLGVCVYQMLVGKPPFVSEEESDKSAAKTFLKDYNMASKYAVLFTDVDYTEIMEDVVAVDFVSKLLEIDDRIRLGSGVEGFFDITSHNFFEGIDWAKLDDKEVEPPFIPEKVEKVVGEDEKGCTFEECLSKIHKKDFLKASKNLIRIQKYFNSYNYTSPDVIVEENKARKKS